MSKKFLAILTEHGIGLSVWNLRGSFGIVDSDRKDVKYEDFHGYKLDRKLLELLQEFA
jgi:endoglucanase